MSPSPELSVIPLKNGIQNSERRMDSRLHGNDIRKSLLWPLLAATFLMIVFFFYQPGRLFADAFEYDSIARSILHGTFSYHGELTMFREPLYPVFRAAVYAIIGIHPTAILIIQMILQLAAIVLVARGVARLNPAWELPTAWLTALYPGFAILASQHYSESFTAFLLVLVGYVWIRLWKMQDRRRLWRWAALCGVLIGSLALTRAVYQYLGLVMAIVMLFFSTHSLKQRFVTALTIFVISSAIMAPWIIRNNIVFDHLAITNRLGFLAYTLVIKAEAPWSQIGVTYSSIFLGRSLTRQFVPYIEPNIIQTWDDTWARKETLTAQGQTLDQADVQMLQEAKQRLISSTTTIVKYVVWRPIDVLRFFALTTPLSPKFSIESMFVAHQNLSWLRIVILIMAHVMQLIWWIAIIGGLGWFLLRRRFDHAALILVGYTIGIHSLLDNIPRYAAPLAPWMLAIVAAVGVSLWQRRFCHSREGITLPCEPAFREESDEENV